MAPAGRVGDCRELHLAETDSTNRVGLELAMQGDPGGLWIRADRQTAGRGRSGRTWVSEAGNLYASLLIRPQCGPAEVAQLSLVAGIAVHDAIARLAPPLAPLLGLKWPNDPLLAGAKVAGILIESTVPPGQLLATVVGVGIDLATHPAETARPTTALADHGLAVEPAPCLEALSRAMSQWIAVWDRGVGFPAIRSAWLERAAGLGGPVSVNLGNGVATGRFTGLDADGALLLAEAAGGLRRITFGDVQLIGAAAAR